MIRRRLPGTAASGLSFREQDVVTDQNEFSLLVQHFALFDNSAMAWIAAEVFGSSR